MCFGGGGGGGRAAVEESNKEAERLEEERKARIAETQMAINSMFDDPRNAARRGNISDNIFNQQAHGLVEQRKDADLASKFALAQRGQLGSSVDISTQRELDERMNAGMTEASSLGERARREALSADVNLQNNLLARAAAGEDQGQLLETAATESALNAARAQDQYAGQTLGDIFQGASTAFTAFDAGARDQIGRNKVKKLLGKGFDDTGLFFEPETPAFIQAGKKIFS